jgi:AcrR family transcriptional regulator
VTAEAITWDDVPLRRVPVQARSREKVARALTVAETILRTEGVGGINLTHVAESAGVSVGALYQYLPDRDAIVAALVWRYHARFESLLDGAIATARDDPPRGDPVDYLIDSVVQIYTDEEAARSLRTSADSPALEEQRHAHKRRMAGKLAELMRAVGMAATPEEGRPVATVAFTAADAILHEAFAFPEPERAALVDELRLLLKDYLAPLRGSAPR